MNKNKLETILVLFLFGFSISAKADIPSYSFTDLGTLGGIASYANAINASGQVVGYSWTADSKVHATLWNGTNIIDLGALGGDNIGGNYLSKANDINDAGQIVGIVEDRQRAVMWDGTKATYLGDNLTNTTSINNAGQIVGVGSVFIPGNGFNTQGASYTQAKLLYGETVTNLGVLSGPSSTAYAINNVGQIAGDADYIIGNFTSVGQATLWNGTTITNLGNGVSFSRAVAINDVGQLAGYSSIPGGGLRASLWTENSIINLDTLGGNQSYASGINALGQVVGSANTVDSNRLRATLWNSTSAIDLNSFLDANTSADWLLTEAKDINGSGWIVGNATNTKTGLSHAFLLTPVPEPETYCMLIMGLGLVGLIARRRKGNQNN